jgi:hypothetical protein
MPITFSIQSAIDAQTTTIRADINAARDVVKTDVTAAITAKTAVKSVQRGTVAMSGAANAQLTQVVTISAVNLSKSFISDSSSLLGTSTGSQAVRAALISVTELELKAQAGTGGTAAQVSWEVIEYV